MEASGARCARADSAPTGTTPAVYLLAAGRLGIGRRSVSEGCDDVRRQRRECRVRKKSGTRPDF